MGVGDEQMVGVLAMTVGVGTVDAKGTEDDEEGVVEGDEEMVARVTDLEAAPEGAVNRGKEEARMVGVELVEMMEVESGTRQVTLM
jgi:hypothetical protein